MYQRLLILGAGTFAEEVADLAADLGLCLAGFAVNQGERPATLLGHPVWSVEQLADLPRHDYRAVGAIVSVARWQFMRQVEDMGFQFVALVHPSASISRTATLEPGVVANRGAIVGCQARIGRHTILNRGAVIGHHLEIGACCTIGPGAVVAGLTHIGDGVLLGMGCQILEKLCIGDEAIVGAGAVVTYDVPAGVKVMGVPARVVDEVVL